MLIALKLLACIILASFGIAAMVQNDRTEGIALTVFIFLSVINAIIALSL